MDAVYRIAKWSETFETADSRRNKTLSWVSLPVDSSNGYNDLVETFGPEAPLIYGAWCALARVAAKAPERGTLADSRGRAYSFSRIAAESRFPVSCFERLFEWAAAEKVGWLVVSQPPPNGSHVGDQPTNRTEPTDPTQPTLPAVDRMAAERTGVGDWYSAWEVSGEHWQEHRVRMQTVLDAVKPTPSFRAAPKDVALVARAVLFEWRYGVELIEPILESIGELTEPAKRPFGYLKTSLVNACESMGVDFYRAMRAIKLPHQQPQAVRSE